MGGLLVLGDAVSVMHLRGTVQAKSNSETLCRKKAAPVLIEEGSVGLNTVGDAPVRGLMLALQRHNLAKVVQSQDGRFPAMPGEQRRERILSYANVSFYSLPRFKYVLTLSLDK